MRKVTTRLFDLTVKMIVIVIFTVERWNVPLVISELVDRVKDGMLH